MSVDDPQLAQTHGMFSRETDWKTATNVICDVMQGSSSLAVETHASSVAGDQRRYDVSKWRYEQTQPFRVAESPAPRLFSLEKLRNVLTRMSTAEIFFAYEVDPWIKLGSETEKVLNEFSDIEVNYVTLIVGDATVAWLLVKLGQPRDVILWKMRYHMRDVAL